MPALPSADLLLTDPPYGIPAGAAVWRRNGTAIEDWSGEQFNIRVDGWLQLAQLATSCYLIEFGGAGHEGCQSRVERHLAAGFQPVRWYALVKQAPPPTPRPTFASALELALISRRGKPKWHGDGYVPDRWIGLTPNRRKVAEHPTQKPIEPTAALITCLSAVGSVVLDPFAGSGTTLVAAKQHGRKGIGVEIDERYCEIAARRLAQDVLDFGEAS